MHNFNQLISFMVQAGEFLIFTVILKVIIAHWLAEHILKYSKKWFSTTERNLAIWHHYMLRAEGKGHDAGSVLECAEGECNLFKISLGSAAGPVQSTSR